MNKITVAICTWNRSQLLDETLKAIGFLKIPIGIDLEVIVVNNNSTDDTDAVISKHLDLLPLRRIFEPRPGKSYAANRAIEEADGDLILWTDDDVVVDRDWLVNYVAAANEHPNAAYFGGTINPLFAIEPPPWIMRHLSYFSGIYAIIQFGNEVRQLEDHEPLFGANMAFRRKMLGKIRFDTNLGPNKDNQVRGDETNLISELKRHGWHGVYVGNARVQHYIPVHRLNETYLWDWFRGYGRTLIRMNGLPSGPMVLGCPRWLLRQALETRLAAFLLSPTKSERWVKAYIKAATLQGFLDETRQK